MSYTINHKSTVNLKKNLLTFIHCHYITLRAKYNFINKLKKSNIAVFLKIGVTKQIGMQKLNDVLIRKALTCDKFYFPQLPRLFALIIIITTALAH